MMYAVTVALLYFSKHKKKRGKKSNTFARLTSLVIMIIFTFSELIDVIFYVIKKALLVDIMPLLILLLETR